MTRYCEYTHDVTHKGHGAWTADILYCNIGTFVPHTVRTVTATSKRGLSAVVKSAIIKLRFTSFVCTIAAIPAWINILAHSVESKRTRDTHAQRNVTHTIATPAQQAVISSTPDTALPMARLDKPSYGDYLSVQGKDRGCMPITAKGERIRHNDAVFSNRLAHNTPDTNFDARTLRDSGEDRSVTRTQYLTLCINSHVEPSLRGFLDYQRTGKTPILTGKSCAQYMAV